MTAACALRDRPESFRLVDQIGISDLVANHPDTFGVVDRVGDSDSVPNSPDPIGADRPAKPLMSPDAPTSGDPARAHYPGNSGLVGASDGLAKAFRNHPVFNGVVAARRARLLRFLAPWTASGGGYEIRVGRTRLSAEVLSDDALEDLAARVIADFWADRRRTRLNRPLFRAALLGPETSRAA